MLMVLVERKKMALQKRERILKSKVMEWTRGDKTSKVGHRQEQDYTQRGKREYGSRECKLELIS